MLLIFQLYTIFKIRLYYGNASGHDGQRMTFKSFSPLLFSRRKWQLICRMLKLRTTITVAHVMPQKQCYSKPLSCYKMCIRYKNTVNCSIKAIVITVDGIQIEKARSELTAHLPIAAVTFWRYKSRLMSFQDIGDLSMFMMEVSNKMDVNALIKQAQSVFWHLKAIKVHHLYESELVLILNVRWCLNELHS